MYDVAHSSLVLLKGGFIAVSITNGARRMTGHSVPRKSETHVSEASETVVRYQKAIVLSVALFIIPAAIPQASRSC
jgi:hypothetical protein